MVAAKAANNAAKAPVAVASAQEFAEVYNNIGGGGYGGHCGGGCFAGECLVDMGNGERKLVKDMTKGDLIATPNGSARVVCVIKSLTMNGTSKICEFENGLMITPGHPIMHNGEWKYPRDIA